MFSDEILEQIFSREETFEIPIEYKTTMINVIEDVLEKSKKGNEYATIY